jgi:hypothetical protein
MHNELMQSLTPNEDAAAAQGPVALEVRQQMTTRLLRMCVR